MTNQNKLKLRINFDLLQYKKGQEILIDCDENGVALDPFWRARIVDAVFDGFVSIVKESKKEEKR